MSKIFTKSYYKGLFLILSDEFAVKIAEKNGKIVFGKLTCSFSKNYKLTKHEASKQFNLPLEYLNYFEENYDNFKVVWNVDFKNHKTGDLYLPEHSGNMFGYPWGFICHHIGYYRRDGNRAINDAWKLGVKGLNVEVFRKFKKIINKGKY